MANTRTIYFIDNIQNVGYPRRDHTNTPAAFLHYSNKYTYMMNNVEGNGREISQSGQRSEQKIESIASARCGSPGALPAP